MVGVSVRKGIQFGNFLKFGVWFFWEAREESGQDIKILILVGVVSAC